MAISPIRRPSRNFYSRPCGRGDAKADKEAVEKQLAISTHAPAGGATGSASANPAEYIISTHAPAGGATYWTKPLKPSSAYFYSRPCGRGDKTQEKTA
mgnify:CR=1 FL=1